MLKGANHRGHTAPPVSLHEENQDPSGMGRPHEPTPS